LAGRHTNNPSEWSGSVEEKIPDSTLVEKVEIQRVGRGGKIGS
jgi:hypothetical protein